MFVETPALGADAHREDARSEDKMTCRREHFRHERLAALSRLLLARQDLRGVHPTADLLDEAVRWSA